MCHGPVVAGSPWAGRYNVAPDYTRAALAGKAITNRSIAMQKLRLFTPGPTMIPAEVMLHMAEPMDHHRTSGFRELIKEVTEQLQYLFQTTGSCLTFTGSGSSAGEAAIVSCCYGGKHKALCVRNGKFSERWQEICDAFDIPNVSYDIEWGHGAKGPDIEKQLDANPDVDTVIVVHSETSTAAVSDLEAIAEVTRRRDKILIVDGITAVGAIPVKMDEWGVDLYITGSQKALMLPPGLAFVAVSDRAWKRIESIKPHAFYNSLLRYRKSMKSFDTPYTPAITLVKGVHWVLERIRDEGLESIWKRTRLLADATRAAAKAMGIELFAADPVDSVTSLLVPAGVDEAALRKTMRSQHGMQIAGGQAQLKGKIIRISHMGYCDQFDTLSVIAALEQTLHAMGHGVKLGAGLTAAQTVLAQSG